MIDFNVSVFDDRVPFPIREKLWQFCVKSTFELSWSDTTDTEKYELNVNSRWTKEELETTQVLPYFKNCIEETDWFTKKNLFRVVLNLVRSNDVHYVHHHKDQQILLYYVNLDWIDGWYGETLFYNPKNLKEILYTSLYQPGRILLFDGYIPHAIRPQSVKGPKFRLSLSLFFDCEK